MEVSLPFDERFSARRRVEKEGKVAGGGTFVVVFCGSDMYLIILLSFL